LSGSDFIHAHTEENENMLALYIPIKQADIFSDHFVKSKPEKVEKE